jgi:hypothetical protein
MTVRRQEVVVSGHCRVLIRARLAVVVAAVVGIVVGASLAPPSAHASERLVTFAARWCESYTDISANRARNDIQESLRDLGRDTSYAGGEAIQPAKELGDQPACQPLPDWRFTLGTAYATRGSVGPWGALTVLTRTFDTSIVTQASTPLLDVDGRETGSTLAGAVTVRLTDAQAALAATSSALWVQGGTPEDPVLDQLFPSQYGFGALRCGIDNLNGDNVEWIAYPSGARHVFCYAYYVRPPPTSGTIIVRKVVDDEDATAPNDFRFEGNISYTPDQTFTLRAAAGNPDSATFYRAATGADDAPWTVREVPQDGWQLASLSCTSSSGASVVGTDPAAGSANVRLAAGDTVTCTYVDRPAPPASGLELAKTTLGAIGSFRFLVEGDGVERRTDLRTTAEGVPVASGRLDLPAGRYTVDEQAPAPTRRGRWRLVSVVCDGRSRDLSLPLPIQLSDAEGHFCEFTNRFDPAGSIVIRKRTFGGTGTAGFVVFKDGEAPFTRELSAPTRAVGVAVRATGDDTSDLPLGRYTIVETGPDPDPDGEWSVDTVVCNGIPVPSAQGRIEVELTASEPVLDCTYTNRFRPGAEPPVDVPEGPSDTPPGPSGGVLGLARANRPRADLQVTKRVSTVATTVGRLVRYTIVVTNRGPHTARNVSGVEFGPRAQDVVSLRASRGRCDLSRRPIVCRVGALRPGRRVVVHVVIRARRARRLVNRVAVSTSTADPNLRNNRARATLIVRRSQALPRYTG